MNQTWTILLDTVTAFFHAVPFTGATWFVLATLAFFVWLFVKANQDKNSPVQWEHLIIDSNNNRASPYKVGYLVGLIVGTWIILTLTDRDKLTMDMFGVYLTYLLGGAGVNSWAKRGDNGYPQTYDQSVPQAQPQIQPMSPIVGSSPQSGPPAYGPNVANVSSPE